MTIRGVTARRVLTMALLLAPCLGLYAAAGETTPCHLETYIDEKSLVALAGAPDASSLQAVWKGLPYHDLVQRAIYCTRLQELKPSKENEVALLETVPGSPIEFRYLYAIDDTKVSQTSAPVSRLFGAYFKTVGQVAAKHESFIRAVLLMNRFADGAAKNDTDDATAILRRLNPSGYLTALKQLDPESQRSVCGDCPELLAGGSGKHP